MSGEVNLGQVSEKQLAQIVEYKLTHQGLFQFDPTTAKRQNPGVEPPMFFQAILSWSTVPGMKAVHDLLVILESA
jgi:hypothetical protein